MACAVVIVQSETIYIDRKIISTTNSVKHTLKAVYPMPQIAQTNSYQ